MQTLLTIIGLVVAAVAFTVSNRGNAERLEGVIVSGNKLLRTELVAKIEKNEEYVQENRTNIKQMQRDIHAIREKMAENYD